jgi:hypothetical protein
MNIFKKRIECSLKLKILNLLKSLIMDCKFLIIFELFRVLIDWKLGFLNIYFPIFCVSTVTSNQYLKHNKSISRFLAKILNI